VQLDISPESTLSVEPDSHLAIVEHQFLVPLFVALVLNSLYILALMNQSREAQVRVGVCIPNDVSVLTEVFSFDWGSLVGAIGGKKTKIELV